MDVLSEIKKVNDDLIKWRRHLHENPELGFDLENTCQFVSEKLDEFGIENHRNFKGAVIGYINPESTGKVIALRGDMDALPVNEETGLEFASKVEGRMHACGHDAHTAQLLAAAKVLAEHKDEIDGKIMLIFQPAEELGTGSIEIADSEEFSKVDEVLGCHDGNLLAGDGVPKGALVFSKGPTMATMDKFTIDIKGRGAHGSQPENSIDPIVIASYIITSVQEIVAREISPLEPVVVSFGIINSGKAFNIIPETAHLEGTTRTLTPEIRDLVARRLGEIAEGIGKTFRAEISYEFFRLPPPVINDAEITEKMMTAAKKLFPEKVIELKKPIMGGEDFAFYLEKKPGAFFFLYNPLEIDGKVYAHHNPRFAMCEEFMHEVPAVMVQYVMDELGK